MFFHKARYIINYIDDKYIIIHYIILTNLLFVDLVDLTLHTKQIGSRNCIASYNVFIA